MPQLVPSPSGTLPNVLSQETYAKLSGANTTGIKPIPAGIPRMQSQPGRRKLSSPPTIDHLSPGSIKSFNLLNIHIATDLLVAHGPDSLAAEQPSGFTQLSEVTNIPKPISFTNIEQIPHVSKFIPRTSHSAYSLYGQLALTSRHPPSVTLW